VNCLLLCRVWTVLSDLWSLDVAAVAEAIAVVVEVVYRMPPAPPRPLNLSRAQVLAHAASRLVETMLFQRRPILEFKLMSWAEVTLVNCAMHGLPRAPPALLLC
jgi:hypothetical protein